MGASPSRAGTRFYPQWNLDLTLGHDDQILSDPEALGVVRPVSDVYYNGYSRFLAHLEDLWRADRLDLSVEGGGVAYGSKVDGNDTNLALNGAYRRPFSSSVTLDLAGSGYRFRRDETAGGEPVFDFNLYRGEMRLGWAAGPRWLWTVGVFQDWIGFPGRFADAESTVTEDQDQFNVTVAALRRFGEEGYLAGWLIYRWTTSNSRLSEYEGPVLSMRGRVSLPHEASMTGYAAVSQRGYASFLAPDSLGLRRDTTWQFGIRAQRPIHSRVEVYLEGSYLHQGSNIDVFAYDQARVGIGVSVDLIPPPARARDLRFRVPDYAPTRRSGGIRFRIRAPGATSVSVVGGWNAWDPEAQPLSGPNADGVWETTVVLKPGIWRYAFVVDGEWVKPPDALRYEDDGFGGENGVLIVPGPRSGSVTGKEETRQTQ